MSSKTAKLFTNGGSQAVRLPAEFRFDDAGEVFIRRDVVTGDVILSTKPAVRLHWARFFELRDQAKPPRSALSKRPLNEPLKPHAALGVK
jgi:antitoxin VapB